MFWELFFVNWGLVFAVWVLLGFVIWVLLAFWLFFVNWLLLAVFFVGLMGMLLIFGMKLE